MYKVKDLRFLEVFNSEGKKLGEIQDIGIDYFEGKIKGFFIPKSFLKKENFIAIEDILTFGEKVVAKKMKKYEGLTFNDIKGMDIIDKKNKMIGVLEELLIDEKFFIRAIITSKGFFQKFKNGKDLILLKETILGEKNILYFSNQKISFVSVPHNIWRY
ncbi:MAG: PRC-barrel domain-containing protein [Sarcina sp.]